MNLSSDSSADQHPKQGLLSAIRLAWDLGYIIALPAALFGFGGAYADRYLQTSPWIMLLGFAVALTLSGVGVYRKVKAIEKDIR